VARTARPPRREARTAKPRAGKLAGDPVLRRYLDDKLALCWPPAQVSRRLTADFPEDPAMRVSVETIYTSLFVQAKGVLRPKLAGKLRTGRFLLLRVLLSGLLETRCMAGVWPDSV
jgi:IS30 family transposase